MPAPSLALRRILSTAALLAIAVWLGGLVALGAVAAPVVFATVSFPSSADAMSIVFRRFDSVAMTCAAIVLATEAVRPVAGLAFERFAHVRAAGSLLAAVAAVFEGVKISPRIAALHAAGAIRWIDEPGRELAHLHDVAEWCGKIELVLLAAVVALHAVALSSPFKARSHL
jgi:putative copper export protein